MLRVLSYKRADFYNMTRQTIIYLLSLILRLISALTHFRPVLSLENIFCTICKVQDSNNLLNTCRTDG